MSLTETEGWLDSRSPRGLLWTTIRGKVGPKPDPPAARTIQSPAAKCTPSKVSLVTNEAIPASASRFFSR